MTNPTETPERPALDFAAIRQQCPKAFAVLISWFGRNVPGWAADAAHVEVWCIANPRNLYDFFDRQGVFISSESNRNSPNGRFYFCRIEHSSHFYNAGSVYPTRADAETAAFRAAFDRLEVILNQNEK